VSVQDNVGELPAELQEFINQLIVPLLVEQFLIETGHLYSADPVYYDHGSGQADLKEAA
jgi:hypothetical protein